MESIVIKGIAGYDGEYPFDASYFTNKELHTIKTHSGVRAGEIQQAFAAGDNDLIVAFAAIALERNGKVVHADVLWNAKVGAIELVLGEDEVDADPPTLGLDESSSERKPLSGETSDADSESPENDRSPTGQRPSVRSVA